jgi:hypothetical protein
MLTHEEQLQLVETLEWQLKWMVQSSFCINVYKAEAMEHEAQVRHIRRRLVTEPSAWCADACGAKLHFRVKCVAGEHSSNADVARFAVVEKATGVPISEERFSTFEEADGLRWELEDD